MDATDGWELFDTHVHLDFAAYDEDRESVLRQARNAGVTRIITVGAGGGGPASASQAVAYAEKWPQASADMPQVWASVGVHPLDVVSINNFQDTLSAIARLATHPRVVAIGEAGIDLYRATVPLAEQEQVFLEQLDLARQVAKPIIIHSRQATAEVMRTLKRFGPLTFGGVVHCFSGPADVAREYIAMGLHISFTGIVTFNKANDVQAAARAVPLTRLMVETDGPFLAPHPFRGLRCESKYVVEIARKIAELRDEQFDVVARATTKNACELFGMD